MIIYIETLIIRDLESLISELNQIKNEELLYQAAPGITNSIGNLALHLCGNLQHFIGANLGKTGYIRNRPLEFSEKDKSISEISQLIKETQQVVKNTLSSMKNEDLDRTYPSLFLEKEVKNGELLMILVSHLSYHLGQINYLRRIFQ